MKRLLGYLSLTCCLFLLTAGASRSADDKPPEKKEEPKPSLTLDGPTSLDVATRNAATLEIKVKPENYKGKITVKLVGLPKETAPLEKTLDGEGSAKFEFVINEKVDKLKLKVEALGAGGSPSTRTSDRDQIQGSRPHQQSRGWHDHRPQGRSQQNQN